MPRNGSVPCSNLQRGGDQQGMEVCHECEGKSLDTDYQQRVLDGELAESVYVATAPQTGWGTKNTCNVVEAHCYALQCRNQSTTNCREFRL